MTGWQVRHIERLKACMPWFSIYVGGSYQKELPLRDKALGIVQFDRNILLMERSDGVTEWPWGSNKGGSK